jgi:2-amino-4-hydroxy-6-hydroxymethyldihydropteridine diphosphokinase
VARAYVGLGANLGDPAAQVRAALEALARHPSIGLVAQSPLYRSAPIGLPGQPDYCNAVCAVDTALSPKELMAELIGIERAAGRVRDGSKWGPRVLDLDLLHVDGARSASAELTLPHPEIAHRNFVLVPWAQIAPDIDVPGVGVIGERARAIGSAGLSAWDRLL